MAGSLGVSKDEQAAIAAVPQRGRAFWSIHSTPDRGIMKSVRGERMSLSVANWWLSQG
jgi:hypothetical protein